jgi:hypothetical protein
MVRDERRKHGKNCTEKYRKTKAQRYCNGTRYILLCGLTTPPGITSRWREIQMLTEVSVYMNNTVHGL